MNRLLPVKWWVLHQVRCRRYGCLPGHCRGRFDDNRCIDCRRFVPTVVEKHRCGCYTRTQGRFVTQNWCLEHAFD